MANPAARVHVQITQFTNVDLSDAACARLDRLLSDCASILTAKFPPPRPDDPACDGAWLEGLLKLKRAFASMRTAPASALDAAAARETYVEAAACMLYAAQLSALYVAPTAANGRAA